MVTSIAVQPKGNLSHNTLTRPYGGYETPPDSQPELTQFPTRDVECINCSRLVTTITTYSPGPLATCLGLASFLSGWWCCILLACSYFDWLNVKHFCPYCKYMIGEHKSSKRIVVNKEALKRLEHGNDFFYY